MFSISRLQRVMQGVPRGTFQTIVERHGGDRYAKSFGCHDVLVAQVFGQLNACRSLRELEVGFNAHAAQHYHLGTRALRRATLADACARRSPAVFEDLARVLMAAGSRQARRHAEQGLRLLDSTSLTLKGRGFDQWTRPTRTRRTQGLKVHLAYAEQTMTPSWQSITAANVNDITAAAALPLEAGVTYVFDKGYCDYGWWARIEAEHALFVTRLKSNARLEVLARRRVPKRAQDMIVADEKVRLTNRHTRGGRKNVYTAPLRRITVVRPGDTDLVLITNDFRRSALEIGECYRARWQIELFFKWMKQNLRVKQFFGRSENAVRIQILCALITQLLIATYRAEHAPYLPARRVLDELRAALFQRPATDAAVEERRRQRLHQLAMRQPTLFA